MSFSPLFRVFSACVGLTVTGMAASASADVLYNNLPATAPSASAAGGPSGLIPLTLSASSATISSVSFYSLVASNVTVQPVVVVSIWQNATPNTTNALSGATLLGTQTLSLATTAGSSLTTVNFRT